MKTSTQEHAQPGSELTLGNVGQILTVFTVEKFPNAKRGKDVFTEIGVRASLDISELRFDGAPFFK